MEEENDLFVEKPVETTTETGTEEVEQTSEEVVNEPVEEKTFTQAQLDKILQERVGRVEKKYAKKYGKLEETLKAGLGTNTLEETTDKVREFYKEQGIEIKDDPVYSDEDERILADHEANRIIDLGIEEINDYINDLSNKTLSNREKYILDTLTSKKVELENEKELKSIGVSSEELNNPEFKNFAKQFNKDVSLKQVYEIFKKTKPQIEAQPIGSMQSTTDKEIKKYYTSEEADKLTAEDYDDPQVFEAVRNSMLKWKS